MIERWRVLPGMSKYAVSDQGRVKRTAPGKGAVVGAILAPMADRKGYLLVTISQDDGTRHRVFVHTLVALAFVGPKTAPQVRHLDGVKTNNGWLNLVWGTNLENQADRYRHGTVAFGERHPGHILTEKQVLAIRAATGTQRAIADRFKITRSHVGDIRSRKIWPHI